jgi:hypothetical protein
LKIPEKKSFFALQIEKLKKNLNNWYDNNNYTSDCYCQRFISVGSVNAKP